MIATLLGGAIGDAKGMPFETMKFDDPRLAAWDRTSYLPSYPYPANWTGRASFKPGESTDDSQMQVMVTESLLDNRGFNPDDLAARYVDWILSGRAKGYGGTTALAVKRLSDGIHWSESGVEGSYGNGTAMRSGPFGVYFRDDLKALVEAVKIDSAMTHKSDNAEAGALAVALAVYYAINKDTDKLIERIAEQITPSETTERIKNLTEYLTMDFPPHYVAYLLGTKGDVRQTAPAALYLFAKCTSYEQAVVAAIRAGGDTDTTASIVGCMFGTRDGVASIPKEWIDGVEDKENLMILDSQLFNRSKSNFLTMG